jgi:hypothetical protein
VAPSNYAAISDENRTRYGTDIGRIGPMLLADRYDDRTHFIFELLQNAEDALGRRGSAGGPRSVTFTLSSNQLNVSHFGRPFDEADVRGVCGIAQSTKDQHSIGRFGIGFKSVYTFTDCPEIHSGDEDFVIGNYVLPTAATPLARADGETQIILPLKSGDNNAAHEIANGFKHLGPSALLFLRHIDEISWSVEGGASGVYMRSVPESLAANVQRIQVIGQETDKPEVDQDWLVFHREVSSTAGEKVGRVEIAFSLTPTKDNGRWAVRPLAASHLVVFFPTVVATNLGFLVQGPYRTTPSRDNVPHNDPWNQKLVGETAGLLVGATRWLRDKEMLDTIVLSCLPMSREKFLADAMFSPLFDVLRGAFLKEQLLPRFGGGYITAAQSRMARTQKLRELFSAEQLDKLFGAKGSAWLTSDITPDRTPELRKYMLQELYIQEVEPDKIITRLNKEFLEAQSDEWLAHLYTFLSSQRALVSTFSTLPLVRLEDGSHVIASANGKPNAFLPGDVETSFPTVRRATCATADARSFLVSLGLTEPDLIDDIIINVLAKYKSKIINIDDNSYAQDIKKICSAFKVDSSSQREKLLKELCGTSFVMAVDAGDGKARVSKPNEIYIATERLKRLFAGVSGVLVVDDRCECLRGEDIRELLEACGAVKYPRPIHAPEALSLDERLALRRQTGYEQLGQREDVRDWELLGIEALLALLPRLSQEQREQRARLLWESLGDLEDRRGRGVFDGSYTWTHYGQRKAPSFPAAFLRRLIKTAWVPSASGDLICPALVNFESLGWKYNPFLLSKIAFKPPIIDQLAKAAGIEPAALDRLLRLGITSVADLDRVGIADKPAAWLPDEVVNDVELQAAKVDEYNSDDANPPDYTLGAIDAASSGYNDGPDLNTAEDLAVSDMNEESFCGEPNELRPTVARGPRSTSGPRLHETARPGQRNITGQSGLDEQAKRLRRRVASFFDGTAPEADDEDVNTATSTGWHTKLVCLDVTAGGLQLEIGPLDGLPSFLKKLRVVGGDGWDAFALAANAKLRPIRVSVSPGGGPWRWEAVGFEDEQDLGFDQLAFAALDVTAPSVFRVDTCGVGQLTRSTTLSLGQSYRLLLPPNVGGEVGTALVDGWRIWTLDVVEQLSQPTSDALKNLGVDIGEASPRLEWALTPASAWRTNARGDSYPVFDEGTELFVNAKNIALEVGDEVMLFLHCSADTQRLSLSTDGLVSLGKPTAGRWACALLHSGANIQTATLVFEIARSSTEHVNAAWTMIVPHGLASLQATAPPGWPVSVRWGGLVEYQETIATIYGNDDLTVSFEEVHSLIQARASRASIADLVVDFRELGRRLIPIDGRASLDDVRAQIIALWHQTSGLVQSRRGMWLKLMSTWFEPMTTRLGYGVGSLAISDGADTPHDLVAWLLTIDERTNGSITRSPSRLLVLTTDVDSVLRDQREWIDNACTVARVRDAIVTDGTRWTTHRKGDRRFRRREWSFGHPINLDSIDEMLGDLTEGL